MACTKCVGAKQNKITRLHIWICMQKKEEKETKSQLYYKCESACKKQNKTTTNCYVDNKNKNKQNVCKFKTSVQVYTIRRSQLYKCMQK